MKRTRLVAALVGLATCALAMTSISPASASPSEDDPALHWAGSQVVKHEGHGDGRAFAPAALTNGLDVSHYQGNVDWSSVAAKGAKFAYVKATEGTTYTDPTFAHQYNGSYNAGLIRGAYHFARPNASSGAAQADYFVAHGGGWSRDGKTLPPMLDIEYAPSGDTCYGLSQASMRSWIQSFVNEVKAKTSRYATIYTTTNWWTQCTGNWSGLGSTNPLFIARYASSVGTLPAGWGFWTIWQYADKGTFPGDQDYFNGAYDRVQALANG
ncbi:lysozyme [Kutzneria viridogrisea]|uniref:Lysozyme n=2 Tax=Kutzneria TaxID=43356 RepID=W5W4F2_9PSEU|nr:lysozyme [Kutzneria albida]AHH95630.1 Lysozyme M1 [Kutzneria albida DSM 43870]MBA8927007.1 GH25 family lysozyme M1 (1,4-beta-N-acetylmuramidase) [Kutzneria viridogrisea]